ncbi:alpha/beta hydrolase [Chromobacterium haemolyticum]|uniref:alpha/beta hydrolase n=1 Tax=Chromobacterium haemolyticum TaxID=394935 RepID=UPI0009D98959|nr:alpha/beta hydrolase [Chromobacterium haemolyticum]OQS38265.1 esterase [Chromobacterium haemolyticum]
MPLDIKIQQWLEQAAAGDAAAPADMAQLRADTDVGLRQLHGPLEPVARVEVFQATARDGHPLRIIGYWPEASEAAQPALLFAHGGGWCLGSAEVYDNPCRALAKATGCVVLSVDYRLAPEHRYPVPLHDVYDALCWAFENAQALGLDPARLGVAGDSAGGNLAAAACLLARDHGGPSIAHQLLIYPALNHKMDSASYQIYGEGYYLTRELMRSCYVTYLSAEEEGASPYVSPLLATRLEGVPGATILTAEFDPLRSEAEDYAARLNAAGVKATARQLDGMVHGCIHMLGLTPAASALFDIAGAEVRAALGVDG